MSGIDARLETYLKGLQKLPANFSQYKTGGEYADLCVFCHRKHVHFPIYVYTKRGDAGTGVITNIHACHVCMDKIKLEESKLEGHSQRHGLVLDKELTVHERLSQFKKAGVFDSTVHLHYQFKEDDLVFPFQKHCYFCKQMTRDGNSSGSYYTLLPVPVEASTRLTGGKVRVCYECRNLTGTEIVGIDLIKHRFHTDVCITCGETYYLSDGEYSQRKLLLEVHDHDCPECTYKNVYGQGDFLKDRALSHNRYSTKTCGACGDKLTLDLTFPFDLLKKLHFESKKYVVNCVKCQGDLEIFFRIDEVEFRIFNDPKGYKVVKQIGYQKSTSFSSKSLIDTLVDLMPGQNGLFG